MPASGYMWEGCRSVDLAPSPKLQVQAVTLSSASVLVSVKLQVRPLQLNVNEADGGEFVRRTVTEAVAVSVALLDARRLPLQRIAEPDLEGREQGSELSRAARGDSCFA